MRSSHKLNRLAVTFDDDRAVADAGLLLAASISERVGLVEAADAAVSTGYLPGRKLGTLVHRIVAGASCIDDLDVQRAGSTGQMLAHKVMAPSTIGTWLRSLTFGHVRQLDKVSEQLLTRSWQLGAGPAGGELNPCACARAAPRRSRRRSRSAGGLGWLRAWRGAVRARGHRPCSTCGGGRW